jgi:CRISPR-associated protein Cas5h
MNRILIFDVWADYAHFKKPYTTTSPLTYSIIPRTSITGIIGAICGIKKDENNERFNTANAHIALGILNPIKKASISENLIDTKNARKMARISPRGGRTQIKIEFLKEPKFRIYIEIFDDRDYMALKNYLSNHESVYTVSLGLSENIANFRFAGEFGYEERQGDTEIDSVINMDEVEKESVTFEMGKEYFSDTLPIEMDKDRVVQKYSEILFERNGKKIALGASNYIAVENGENLVWY